MQKMREACIRYGALLRIVDHYLPPFLLLSHLITKMVANDAATAIKTVFIAILLV